MLRFFGLNSLIILLTLFFCLLSVVFALTGCSSRFIHFHVAKPWARMVLWVSRVKIVTRGCEEVDERVPRIYMTNHQSYFDILGLLAYLPVDFKFLMKQELMRIPLFGFAMKRAGYIGIERNDPRKAVKSMQNAAERIRKGASVLIFPEGTRSKDGRLQEFKRGGFKLALKSQCDIVPVVIEGSCRIMPKGSFTIQKGQFGLTIGEVIRVADYGAKDIEKLMSRVREVMERELERSFSSGKERPC
jgi:1-acyl-sn-glycerol-3-phosphate acyltransferase